MVQVQRFDLLVVAFSSMFGHGRKISKGDRLLVVLGPNWASQLYLQNPHPTVPLKGVRRSSPSSTSPCWRWPKCREMTARCSPSRTTCPDRRLQYSDVSLRGGGLDCWFGGVEPAVLVEGTWASCPSFQIAHLNHQVRGNRSLGASLVCFPPLAATFLKSYAR